MSVVFLRGVFAVDCLRISIFFFQEKWVDKSNWIDREERDWGEAKGVDMWGEEAEKQMNIMEKEKMMWTEQRPKYRKN